MGRWGTTIIGAAATAALMLGSGSIAYADNLETNLTVDSLVVTAPLDLGALACESTQDVSVSLKIDRGGNADGNTYKSSSTVAFTAPDKSGVTATDPSPSSIVMPSGWAGLPQNSDVDSDPSTSVITVEAGDADGEDFSGSVTYRASGTAADNTPLVKTATITITWDVEDCDTTPRDSTAPVVVLTCPGQPVAQNAVASATWNATDEGGSGLAGESTGEIPLQTSTLGAHTVTAPAGTAVDNAGNESAEATCGYTVVDITPPVVVLTCPTDPISRGTTAYATWTASDEANGSGLATALSGQVELDTSTLGEKIAAAEVGTAVDVAGNPSAEVTCRYTVVDTTRPVVALSCPIADVVLGSDATVSWSASDEEFGSGLATAEHGSIQLATSSIGSHIATVPAGTAVDNAGNESLAVTCQYRVVYAWDGFFRPVDMGGVVNSVKAGSGVPMKFSLSGDQGLGIVAAGWPKITFAECGVATVDPIESTVTAGASSLSYDALADQYVYVWKTDKSWAGKCGTFSLKLVDGTTHSALFKFLK